MLNGKSIENKLVRQVIKIADELDQIVKETNFLENGKNLGKKIENGKKMFIYQAAKAFKIWHGIEPKINEQVIGLLDK